MDIGKVIDANTAPLVKRAEAIRDRVNGVIKAFWKRRDAEAEAKRLAEEEERRKEEERAKKKAAKKGQEYVAPPPPPPPAEAPPPNTVTTSSGGRVQGRMVTMHEIVDLDEQKKTIAAMIAALPPTQQARLLPARYWVPDTKLLATDVKAKVFTQINGVKIWEEKDVSLGR